MKQLGEVVGKLVTVTSEYVRRATLKECIAVAEQARLKGATGDQMLAELRKLHDTSPPAIASEVLRYIREGGER